MKDFLGKVFIVGYVGFVVLFYVWNFATLFIPEQEQVKKEASQEYTPRLYIDDEEIIDDEEESLEEYEEETEDEEEHLEDDEEDKHGSGIEDALEGLEIDPSCKYIKGNIAFKTGEKIYHVKGQRYYDDTQIDPEYDETFFCSEQEAQDAGWRKSYK